MVIHKEIATIKKSHEADIQTLNYISEQDVKHLNKKINRLSKQNKNASSVLENTYFDYNEIFINFSGIFIIFYYEKLLIFIGFFILFIFVLIVLYKSLKLFKFNFSQKFILLIKFIGLIIILYILIEVMCI